MRRIRKGWTVFDEFPPIFVRILAREKVIPNQKATSAVRVLSDEEISIRSGLTPDQVDSISQKHDWETVPVGTARLFCLGCNFDMFDWRVRNSAFALAKGGSFAYLRSSPEWKSKYMPLLKEYFNGQTSKDSN
jgi:hypothetical protein